MGCFSYLCKNCGKPINSDSFSGQHCKLILLKNGKIIEEMSGQYNSYGRVFMPGYESNIEWKSMEWGKIVDLCFNEKENCGIAAFHTRCAPKNDIWLKTQSDSDENQGWGTYVNPKTDWAKHILFGKVLVDTDNPENEISKEEIEELIQKSADNIVKEQEEELQKLIEISKKQLGDLYPIKEAIEEFTWQTLTNHNPNLCKMKDLDIPINRKMYIHAFILGMFDIFKN